MDISIVVVVLTALCHSQNGEVHSSTTSKLLQEVLLGLAIADNFYGI
jgi:hypothetical protein